jgi:hypothetical protein
MQVAASKAFDPEQAQKHPQVSLSRYAAPAGNPPRATRTSSSAIAAVIGVGEELLWRGTSLDTFPDHPTLAQLYATLGFALWYLAPLRIFPSRSPGGSWAFVAISGIIGGLYSVLAQRQRTIRWTALSHSLSTSLGLVPYCTSVLEVETADVRLTLYLLS